MHKHSALRAVQERKLKQFFLGHTVNDKNLANYEIYLLAINMDGFENWFAQFADEQLIKKRLVKGCRGYLIIYLIEIQETVDQWHQTENTICADFTSPEVWKFHQVWSSNFF